MTIYVETTGSDPQPGTHDAPVLTIERGLALAQPGEVVQCGAGDFEGGISRKHFKDGVTLRGVPGKTRVVNTRQATHTFELAALGSDPALTLENLIIHGAGQQYALKPRDGVGSAARPCLTVRNCTIYGGAIIAAHPKYCTWLTFENVTICGVASDNPQHHPLYVLFCDEFHTRDLRILGRNPGNGISWIGSTGTLTNLTLIAPPTAGGRQQGLYLGDRVDDNGVYRRSQAVVSGVNVITGFQADGVNVMSRAVLDISGTHFSANRYAIRRETAQATVHQHDNTFAEGAGRNTLNLKGL